MLVLWFHFVPAKEDLSDLREKYEWAETHQRLARRISENGTKLARSLGTPEGSGPLARRFYTGPLTRMMDAYLPVTTRNKRWENFMNKEGSDLKPIIACKGYHHYDCERLVDDVKYAVHDLRDVTGFR